VWAGALSWCKIHDGTPKHTQTIIDVTQKETVVDQQHSCETLTCQRHQTILTFLSTAATASIQWWVRELYCKNSVSLYHLSKESHFLNPHILKTWICVFARSMQIIWSVHRLTCKQFSDFNSKFKIWNLKFLKFLKITTCFFRYGHHQVLKSSGGNCCYSAVVTCVLLMRTCFVLKKKTSNECLKHSRTIQATKNKREHDTPSTTRVRIRGTHVTAAE
jgi:hypothetical protein